MTRLSGSSIERALACPASAVLPRTDIILPAGLRGTAIHEFLARVPAVGVDAALAQVPEEYREECAGIDLEGMPLDAGRWAAEVAWAYDVGADTARELGRGMGRAYEGVRAGEIPGTADVVGVDGDVVAVLDFKSGRLARKGRAVDSIQLRAYSLFAARAYGVSRARAALGHIGEDGRTWWDWAEFDELDLDAMAAELRGLVARIAEDEARLAAGEQPRVVEGDHCLYCPAFSSCPAKTSLALSLGVSPEGVAEAVLTPETAPQVLARLEAAEAVLASVRASLEQYAHGAPFSLPSGEVFGVVATTRESIDPARGALVLAREFSEKVALDAIESKQTMTKERLKKALRNHVLEVGGKIGKTEDRALAALRKVGAVNITTTYAVRRHKPAAALQSTNNEEQDP